jgi:hypothetical protein
MWDLLVLVHLVALATVNVVAKPADKTTKLGRWYGVIQIAAGLISDKVRK